MENHEEKNKKSEIKVTVPSFKTELRGGESEF